MNEHRRFPRWQVNRMAKFRLEEAVDEAPCQVRDINYKGLGIISGTKLPEDTAVRLYLRLSEDCVFDAEVWVAWVKVINGVNHYGLYFSKLRDVDKEKIYRFVHAHLPGEIIKNWWPQNNLPEKDKTDTNNIGKENQNNGSMNDHRIFERFPVNITARYLNLGTGKEGLANTRDVSAKGLGLATNEELRLHTALEIWLQMKDKEEPLYTRGQVVWSKMIDANSYRSGVELEKADLMGISRVMW